jgi:hypothetical protein
VVRKPLRSDIAATEVFPRSIRRRISATVRLFMNYFIQLRGFMIKVMLPLLVGIGTLVSGALPRAMRFTTTC